MIIKVDREGMKIIEQLVDIALKQSGIKNFEAVNRILNSCTAIEESKKKEDHVNEKKES